MKKKQREYLISLDYTVQQQQRLKRFAQLIDKTVRAFTAEAIENEIQRELKEMTPKKRAFVIDEIGEAV